MNKSIAPKVGHLRRRIGISVLVSCVALILVAYSSGIRFFQVPSRSMVPTLYPGDYIVARASENYQRGDVVVFRDPDLESEYLVKRIVGVGGDVIEVKGGAVFINDHYASEPYRYSPIDYRMSPYIVPEGELFLLGDNSNSSIDSHNWGAAAADEPGEVGEDGPKGSPRSISEDYIIGRVTHVYLPAERRGPVNAYPLRGTVKV